MKKSILLVALAALMAACGGKYTVKGTIDGIADGEYVKICDIVNGTSLQTIDSVMVKGGKYSLKGVTDTSDVCVMTFDIDGEMHTCTFFLEPGNIKVNYANEMQTISGTPANDGFQRYYVRIDELNQKAEDLQNRLNKAAAEDREVESYIEEMNGLQDFYRKIVKESIEENASNTFGIQQLLDNFSIFEPDELEPLIEKVSQTYGGNEYMIQLKALNDVQMKTAIGHQYTDVAANMPGKDGYYKVSLSDYVGKNELVMLDFWASWCSPCRSEIPNIKAAYEKYHSKGFEIVSISVDESEENWKQALAEEHMDWPQMIDPQDSEESPAFVYAIQAIPSSFLIDKEGTIIARNLRGSELEEALADYFK